MALYFDEPFTDKEVGCYSYGTGASHEDIIEGAGGHIGYDGFQDPRPGHSGPIKADRMWIKDGKIVAADFVTREGEYCCSYCGSDYDSIKDSNRRDMERKNGLDPNKGNSPAPAGQTQTNSGYNSGVTRR